MRCGAVILCGGKSSRMGRDKATLPFGPECMLQRVVRLLSQAVDPGSIVVVASSTQNLPELPLGVSIARDEHPDRGPLEGISAGLRNLGNRIDMAYVTSCDVPFLVPDFVSALFASLADFEIVVLRDDQHYYPLNAVYRPSVLPQIEQLLSENRLRTRLLFEVCRTREVPTDALRGFDPALTTLDNLNCPEDYERALAAAGFS